MDGKQLEFMVMFVCWQGMEKIICKNLEGNFFRGINKWENLSF